MAAVVAGLVVGGYAFLSYDVRYAVATLQRDTPDARVEMLMDAVVSGDERAAFAAWRIPDRGHPPTIDALKQRRDGVIRTLLARRPASYSVESVEWWSMCCMPHIISEARYASGARYTIDIDGAKYRADVFALDREALLDRLPATRWVLYDVCPIEEKPLYNTFPGR